MARYGYMGHQADDAELARLCPANTSEATFYTAVEAGAADCWLTVVNITGSAATVTVAYLDSGGSTGNEDYEMNAYSLAARGRRVIPIGGMKPGDLIKVTSGTSNAITYKLRGKKLA